MDTLNCYYMYCMYHLNFLCHLNVIVLLFVPIGHNLIQQHYLEKMPLVVVIMLMLPQELLLLEMDRHQQLLIS